MGLTKLTQAIAALQQADLRTERSFPAGRQPELTEPALAVGIHRCVGESVTLAVRVFVTPEQGGSLCEDTALRAAEVLERLGAVCTQEACEYDRSTGLLSVRVLAAWEVMTGPSAEAGGTSGQSSLGCTVKINGRALPCLTGVSAQLKAELYPIQAVGEGTVFTRWEETFWDITVEELLPLSSLPEALSIAEFSLHICRSGGTEQYPGCRWVSICREDTPWGVRQVRIARTQKERGVVSG